MDLGQLETLFWYANVLAVGWLLFSILRQRLARQYPALFFYLLTDFIQQSIGIIVVRTTTFAGRPYFIIYSIGQILKISFAAWILVELARASLAAYPALAKYAQRISRWAVLAAIALSAVLLWLTPPKLSPRGGWTLPYFLAFERSVDLSLIVLLLGLAIFVGWFPVRLSRNAAYYLGGYFTFFLIRWIGNNGQSFAPAWRIQLSTAMLGCAALCLGGLAIWLTKQGESETVVPGHSWNPEAMERLQGQIEAMNQSLARARPEV